MIGVVLHEDGALLGLPQDFVEHRFEAIFRPRRHVQPALADPLAAEIIKPRERLILHEEVAALVDHSAHRRRSRSRVGPECEHLHRVISACPVYHLVLAETVTSCIVMPAASARQRYSASSATSSGLMKLPRGHRR